MPGKLFIYQVCHLRNLLPSFTQSIHLLDVRSPLSCLWGAQLVRIPSLLPGFALD